MNNYTVINVLFSICSPRINSVPLCRKGATAFAYIVNKGVLAHWKPASFRQVQSKMAMNVHWYVLSYSCEYACISAWTLLFILTWKVLAGTSMRRISRVRYHAFYMYRGCLVPPSRNALPAVRNPKYALQLHRVCRFPSDSLEFFLKHHFL